MESIFDLYQTEPSLEKDGVWFDFGKFGRIKLSRAGGANQAFRAALLEAYKPVRREIALGTLTEEEDIKILQGVFARNVVKDFEFTSRDGNLISYSPEAAADLFAAMPEFWNIVRTRATNYAAFRVAEQEDTVKKS